MTSPSIARCVRASILAAVSAACGLAQAQPLPATCSGAPVTYRPYGMSEFTPAMVGTPMLRHTLAGANSRCNDGSQAVMYVRPANAYYSGPQLPAAARKPERWVIYFEGGGGCQDPDACLARWCSSPGTRVFERAAKMSTLGAFDATGGGSGIFSRNPAVNDFAGYNQVWLYYCSSDNWIGSNTLTGVAPSAGAPYDIEFQGEAIVNDAFAQLALGGVGGDAGPAATYYATTLPALSTAEEVVLAGESAGGGGLRHHLDRLRGFIHTQAPGARVVGLIDAGLPPALWTPAINWAASPFLDYDDYLTNAVGSGLAFWGADPSALDASCQAPGYAAAHNAIGVHPEICADTTYTLLNHITTPFFVRMDIGDTLADDRYAGYAFYPSGQAYHAALFNQLVALAGSAGGLEPFTAAPRVYGPQCGQHVALMTSNGFFAHHVSPAGNTFHDLFETWLHGGGLSSQIQQDFNPTPVYTPSFCP
jgi:hypothetical protein